MKVTLIHATPDAEDILIFTKQTRIEMKPELMAEIRSWPYSKKLEELAYMSKTIPSSWEFADLIFLIQDVTRAFTHQLVRTRTASFAQQTMRVLDMTGFDYETGPTITDNPDNQAVYHYVMRAINLGYQTLIEQGAKAEDARGILPTNIHTNIVMKLNLRSFVDLVRAMSSGIVQGEYSNVLKQMVSVTKEQWPWIDLFLSPQMLEAKERINRYLKEQLDLEIQTKSGLKPNETKAWSVMKDLDLIK